MILYIDMDGVVASFAGAIATLDPKLQLEDSGPGYEERSKRCTDLCIANPRIFKDLEPMKGANEAIQVLKRHFEIYFLSTPMWDVPESYTDKRLWLESHYGQWAHKRLILTHRKDLNWGDFLIDDTKRNGVEGFQGEHIHIFTDPQFPDWRSVTNYLITTILV